MIKVTTNAKECVAKSKCIITVKQFALTEHRICFDSETIAKNYSTNQKLFNQNNTLVKKCIQTLVACLVKRQHSKIYQQQKSFKHLN